jgi:hypothetical protein
MYLYHVLFAAINISWYCLKKLCQQVVGIYPCQRVRLDRSKGDAVKTHYDIIVQLLHIY